MESTEQNCGCQGLQGGRNGRCQSDSKFQLYEMHWFWRSKVQPGNDAQQYCIVYEFAKMVDLKGLHYRNQQQKR